VLFKITVSTFLKEFPNILKKTKAWWRTNKKDWYWSDYLWPGEA
jgi:hypothetical protein